MGSVKKLVKEEIIAAADISETYYMDKNNQKRPMLELNETAALIAMPFIGGIKSKEGQKALVNAFMKSRAILQDQSEKIAILEVKLKNQTSLPYDKDILLAALQGKYSESLIVQIMETKQSKDKGWIDFPHKIKPEQGLPNPKYQNEPIMFRPYDVEQMSAKQTKDSGGDKPYAIISTQRFNKELIRHGLGKRDKATGKIICTEEGIKFGFEDHKFGSGKKQLCAIEDIMNKALGLILVDAIQ